MQSLWKILKNLLFVGRTVSIGVNFHLGILSYVSASRSMTIGDDVYIGKFCSIQCSGIIGNGVLIANNVGIIGRADHDMRAVGVPMRLSPWIGDASRLADDPDNWVTINDDVWIGFGAIVLSGITIGRGAVIAAGSVVTRDVKPYAIVAGNPARPIGQRFTLDQINEHERRIKARGSSRSSL